MSTLRGVLDPVIDARVERDTEIQALLGELDRGAAERTSTAA